MSDLMATVERLREAQELERLRAEVAELKARWDDYGAVSARAQRLGTMQSSAPMFPPWALQARRTELFYAGMSNLWQNPWPPKPAARSSS